MNDLTKQPLTMEEMMAMVEASRQQRIQTVQAEIQAALKAHNCDLTAIPQINEEGRIVAVIGIVAR